MKANYRIVLAALLAAMAFGTIASASASAAECPGTETGKVALCIEGKKTVGEVPFTAKANFGAVLTIEGGIAIKCGKVSSKGTFLPVASNAAIKVSKLTVEFTSCTMSAPANCRVKEPFTLEKLSGEATETTFTFFPAENQTRFGVLTIINSGGTCAIGGADAVTTEGHKTSLGPVCTLSKVTEESAEHEANCPGSKSHLEINAAPAELELPENIALSGAYLGKKWSIQKN
ncbi:MAG TPA: hypothetical protein VGG98_11435 [Solirubrobacteraceae bacterium]|jgi:hypothetical protein